MLLTVQYCVAVKRPVPYRKLRVMSCSESSVLLGLILYRCRRRSGAAGTAATVASLSPAEPRSYGDGAWPHSQSLFSRKMQPQHSHLSYRTLVLQAVYNFWVDHLRPEGSLGAMPTTASYGDLVRHFSRYHQNPDEDSADQPLVAWPGTSCILQLACALASMLRVCRRIFGSAWDFRGRVVGYDRRAHALRDRLRSLPVLTRQSSVAGQEDSLMMASLRTIAVCPHRTQGFVCQASARRMLAGRTCSVGLHLVG